MKKIISKYFLLAACGCMGLTSCIEETFPTSTATADQLGSSAKATEALVWAAPAFLNNVGTYSEDYAYDWGFGSMMHVRDVLTADMVVTPSGYNWFSGWSTNDAQGERYVSTAFTWRYYYKAIQTANNIIGVIDDATASDAQKGIKAIGYTYRALFYLDAARTYEFLPNDIYGEDYVTDAGNSIINLTIPIVTPETTEEQAHNNPRATREEMFNFINGDLTKAEADIEKYDASLKSATVPTLSTVYGLKARLYMWVEQYDSAAVYARKAIDLGTNKVMSETEWTDPTTGFNTVVSSWMLASQQTAEDRTVTSGILNFVSWLSNEAAYGYAAAGPNVMIGSNLYEQINNADFRKKCFKAPSTNPVSGSEKYIDKAIFDALPTYASLKFRPGEGNTGDSKVGSCTAYPIMRVEEMYFIEAEAKAHAEPAEGKAALESFMNNYRCPGYTCKASDKDGVVKEIIAQKSIEFFGEGVSFFDIKRLDYSVDRTLNKNVDDSERFKTEGRPAWMNMCLTYSERTNNKGVDGFQNPDYSGKYTAVLSE